MALSQKQLSRIAWACFLAAAAVVILTAAFETGLLR